MARIHIFPTGKIPADILEQIVFTRLGSSNTRVILGPSIGEDAAVIDMGEQVLIVTTDPITGALGNIGFLAVHVNANDVATRGAKPQWFFCTILLPENADKSLLEQIMIDMDKAARELNVAIVGGHSETTPGLSRPIIVGFMMGETPKNRYLTTAGVQRGDALILTKGAGIEGTAVLASDLHEELSKGISETTLQNAQGYIEHISVVKEAMEAMRIGGVHAMHDPTEGGVLNGVWEMAQAAGKGVEIQRQDVRVSPETKEICRYLQIDPLTTLGSGALLIAAEPSRAKEITESLNQMGIEASVIGQFRSKEDGYWIKEKNGKRTALVPPEQDEIYRVLSRYQASHPQT